MASKIFRPKAMLVLTSIVSALLLYLFLAERNKNALLEVREADLSSELETAIERLNNERVFETIDSLLVVEDDLNGAADLLDSLGRESQAWSLAFRMRQKLVALARNSGLQTNISSDELVSNHSIEREISRLVSERDSLLNTIVLLKSNSQRDFEALSAELDKVRGELRKHERVKVLSFPGQKGATVHYLGEVTNGQANGGGIGIWTTGSVYRGEWKNNLRHGEGSFQWADGEKYIGSYVNGKREGMGVYLWPSGDKYDGEWKNDRRNGQGTLFDLDGRIVFSGLWVDDQPKN